MKYCLIYFNMHVFFRTCVLLLHSDFEVSAQALMTEPPQRSSLWRHNHSTPINHRDGFLNCGGYDWQWTIHEGKCGVCGDKWNGAQDHADNGKYASGITVNSYKEGHYINITFHVSSNYLGHVEFRLCPRNSTDVPLNQSCFELYPLWIEESQNTRYYLGSRGGMYDIHARLPGDLVCSKCVLQWTYTTGYRYNGDSTCSCLGCGQQEEFVNCADIEITSSRIHAHSLSGHHHTGHSADSDSSMFTTAHNSSRSKSTIPSSILNKTKTFDGRRVYTTGSPRRRDASVYEKTININSTWTVSKNRRDHIHNTPQFTQKNSMIPRNLTVNNRTLNEMFLANLQQQTSANKKSKNDSSPTYIVPVTIQLFPRKTSAGQMNNVTMSDLLRQLRDVVGKEISRDIRILFIQPENKTIKGGLVQNNSTAMRLGLNHAIRNVINGIDSAKRPISKSNKRYPNSNDHFVPDYEIRVLTSLARARGLSISLPPGCDITSDEFRCRARDQYKTQTGLKEWCEINCRINNCVTLICECGCDGDEPHLLQQSKCHAISAFAGTEGMDLWCTVNCKLGFCPPHLCSVEHCLPQ